MRQLALLVALVAHAVHSEPLEAGNYRFTFCLRPVESDSAVFQLQAALSSNDECSGAPLIKPKTFFLDVFSQWCDSESEFLGRLGFFSPLLLQGIPVVQTWSQGD